MKNILLISALFIVFGTANAQEPQKPGQAAGKTNDRTAKNMFTDNPLFDIYFFGQAPTKSETPVQTDVGTIYMTTYMYEKSLSEVYMVAVSAYPESAVKASDPGSLLSGAKSGFLEQLGISSVDEKKLSINGHPGIYFSGKGQSYYAAMADYLIDNKLVQIGILRSDRMPSTGEINEFIYSFRLKSTKKYSYFEDDPSFRINFLGKKPEKSVSPVETAVGTIYMTTYMIEENSNLVYMVAMSDYPEEYMSSSSKSDLLTAARDGYLGSMDLKIGDERNLTHKGHPGLYFQASGGGYYTTAANYMVNNRLYQVAILRTDRESTQQEIEDFIFSFELK